MFFEPENRPSTSQLSPAIHHYFTTKHHVQPLVLAKTPSKKHGPTTPKKLLQKHPSSGRISPL
jgi:hypothetical protein